MNRQSFTLFALFFVQFRCQLHANSASEENVEVVLSRHHLESLAVAQVQQKQQNTMPYLRDYRCLEAVFHLSFISLIKCAYYVDNRKHSAIRCIVLPGRIEIYLFEFSLRSFFLQFFRYFLTIILMSVSVVVQRIINHYFIPLCIYSNNEPVSIGNIDQKNKLLVCKIFIGVALVIDKYISFRMSEQANSIITVIVVVIGSFHLLQVLNHSRSNGIIQPFILPQSFENVVSDNPSILCLEVVHLTIIQISIMVTLSDISAALNYLFPVEGTFLIWQERDDTFKLVLLSIKIFKYLTRFCLEICDFLVKVLECGKCQIGNDQIKDN